MFLQRLEQATTRLPRARGTLIGIRREGKGIGPSFATAHPEHGCRSFRTIQNARNRDART